MTLKISAAHRDALYLQSLDWLCSIDDLWMKVKAEDWEQATHLGWAYSDLLHLILDDLKWGEGPGQSIELTAPPDVLRRAFKLLLTTATDQRVNEEPEWEEIRSRENRNRLVTEACEVVLADLALGADHRLNLPQNSA